MMFFFFAESKKYDVMPEYPLVRKEAVLWTTITSAPFNKDNGLIHPVTGVPIPYSMCNNDPSLDEVRVYVDRRKTSW
jgi:hypothetical protein